MKLSSLFSQILKENAPQAAARISGSPEYPRLRGMVRFFRTPLGGILIEAEVTGLPCSSGACFYGMHIHENGDCTPPFDKTGMHYNPGENRIRSMQGIFCRFLEAEERRGAHFMTDS